MDIASGIFALGGVALAGLVAEVRARRDAWTKRTEAATTLKRHTYSEALGQIEVVASRCARWLEASEASARLDAATSFWDALLEAYRILGDVRLICNDQRIPEVMNGLLRIYRDVIEKAGTQFPKQRDQRRRLIELFRKDLGVD